VPLLLCGCLGTKHLKENEKRLVNQSIISSGNIDNEPLRELYAEKTNRRFIGIPGLYHLVGIYYFGARFYDREKYVRKKARIEKKFDEKIKKAKTQRKVNNLQFRKRKKIIRQDSFIENGNLWMQWGEPIAVYDSTLVKTTIDRFTNYLFSEGYFQNRVSTKITSIGKYVSVVYRVDPGPAYIIDTVIYNVPDENVMKIIRANDKNSAVKKGRYSEEKMSSERDRIDVLLKDNGFFDFSRQYIEWRVDTSNYENNKAAVMLLIHDPAKRGYHKQFKIDSVKFTTDAGIMSPGHKRQVRMYRDIQYRFHEDNYNLKILTQRLFVAPGQFYSRTNSFNSQRQLANLDAFKFVNINYDTSGGKFIANIFTSPLDRYEWANEVGINMTQGFPGPFYNVNFKKRNIFKGLENFELSGRLGIEGVASASDPGELYRSTEAGANASLLFPQFIWPLRASSQVKLARYNPKTKLSVGYSFSERPEYQRTATTLSNTYTWQNKKITQYSAALTNISVINSDINSREFDSVLQNLELRGNYNLARSFRPSFVSSMIFGITWNRDYGTYDRNAVFVRAQFESGGTSLNLIGTDFITKTGLQYFKYLRFNFDFRKLKLLNRWVMLAYRFNSGVAYSYGSKGSLPYEKFFFAGGSSSVRAWSPRRLGLGSAPPVNGTDYDALSDGTFDYQFEKPGEILMEGSVELRSKIIGFIDGAIFMDAGNVWAFQKPASETIGNSQFKAESFYKEIALGTGFGFRFDFAFLILRFDVGIKVYDPARMPSQRFVLDDLRFFKPYATKIGVDENNKGIFTDYKVPAIYNIGIGFPF
jgi:outer membrane protein insertion porin family